MSASIQPVEFDPAVVQAQQALYRLAALSLLDPRAGAWEHLDALRNSTLLDDAACILQQEAADSPLELGLGELPLSHLKPAALLAELPATADALNRQYEAVFGLLVSGACPPYETEFINGKFAVQRSQTLADISGFYNVFGLKPSSTWPERHDHIVLELEFMACLLGLELRAAESEDDGRTEHLATCREARERFLREHLTWWAPAFAHLLAREAIVGFYRQAAKLLAAILTVERHRYGLPTPQQKPQPSTLERPEECEGCSLAPL